MAAVAIMMVCGSVCSVAQESGEEFSMATLNVDGLPKRISVFELFDLEVNPDGPGKEYTPAISQYLAQHAYDFVAVQENFDYHAELCSALDSDYSHDFWNGGMTVDKFLWEEAYFPFDGVNLFWRNSNVTAERTDSVPWVKSYGKVDHANDDLIKKGFRRYNLQLKGGSQLVVYNMHMDASDDKDEAVGEDKPDREVRMMQWRQLRDSILSRLDKRPVIVCGDLNSFYERDSVKLQFIDEIEKTGRATVGDVFITLERNGQYPALREGSVMKDEGATSWEIDGQTLDKILYINPTGGGVLTPLTFTIDREGYVRENGQMLGDHYPLSATFRISPQGSSAITSVTTTTPADDAYYDLIGSRLNNRPTRKGIYIHRGKKIVVI